MHEIRQIRVLVDVGFRREVVNAADIHFRRTRRHWQIHSIEIGGQHAVVEERAVRSIQRADLLGGRIARQHLHAIVCAGLRAQISRASVIKDILRLVVGLGLNPKLRIVGEACILRELVPDITASRVGARRDGKTARERRGKSRLEEYPAVRHSVELYYDVAAVAGAAVAGKAAPQRLTRNRARDVGARCLVEDRIGNVDPLDHLRVPLVARPVARRSVRVGRCIRNGVPVEADSDSQDAPINRRRYWSRERYVGFRLRALCYAAVAVSNLFEQFRLQGWARFMIAKHRYRLCSDEITQRRRYVHIYRAVEFRFGEHARFCSIVLRKHRTAE